MPRANRHYVPRKIWHLTHRCHDRQFLLNARHERLRWISWAAEARRRFRLCVLNYCVTCNHVHLLVRDKGRKSDETIARSMQLIEGCTAQEYNERKNRRGSFWDDRYHATAVESGQHLMRCMAYINLNMVRAGVVSDPADWPHSGYSDILSHKKRNRIIDYEELFRLFDVPGMKALQERMIQLTAQALAADGLQRQPWWTETVAVGGKEFVERMIEELGIRVGRRSAESEGDRFVLRECSTAYGADFEAKTRSIHVDNTRTWIVSRSL